MKTNIFPVLAISALLFVSCSKEGNDTDNINNGQVRFTSGVSGTQTKVGGTDGDQWEGNERIGIYMVNNGLATIAENAENILYTTTSTGIATAFTSTTPIYYPVDATQKVDFIAYHPHSAAVSSYVYPVDVTTQTNQSAIDLMRAFDNNGTNGYDKTNGTNYINLVFDHKLTKVIINTTPDTNNGLTQADLTNMTVTIKGLNTKADYEIDADVLTEVSPAVVAPIVTKTTTAGTLYEAIVIPQLFAAGVVTVEFALNNAKNEVFVYNVPAATFAKAEKHTFDVKVQRTKVQVRGTIKEWTSVGTVSGTAK